MTTRAPNACLACKHFLGKTYDGPGTCEAFPGATDDDPQGGSIPDVIWSGENSHEDPYDGDHGIQFEVQPGFEDAHQVYVEFRNFIS